MILIGELSLWVALLLSVWGAAVSFAGGALQRDDLRESGERAVYATLLMLLLSSLGLWSALFSHDFSVSQVAQFSSANLPRVYLVAAFWAGRAGTTLFWCLMLAACSSIAVFTHRARNREMMPFVTGALAIILVLFIAMTCLRINPFERLEFIPAEGRGMNPALQNPWMVIHPPLLYIGYACTVVPFGFAIAALVTRRFDVVWIRAVQRWTLVAWFFNTIAIVAGMRWAYVEPQAGYWLLNPLENASLLPWIAGTALLHSLAVQERHGTLRKWSVSLVVSVFLLSVFAAFVARRDIASSVSAFAQTTRGVWFIGILITALLGAVYMVATRLDDLEVEAKSELKWERYGGYLSHAAIVLVLAGFIGQSFAKESGIRLVEGTAHDVVDPYGQKWELVSQGLSQYDQLNRHVTALAIDLSRNGRRAGVMTTQLREYIDSRGAPVFAPHTQAGIKGSWLQDVYVTFAGVDESSAARIRIAFNPLVRLIWLGGALAALGGLIVMMREYR